MNGRWKFVEEISPLSGRKNVARGVSRRSANPPSPPPLRRLRKQHYGNQGFALVFTLLLLSMMSLIALAMVLSSSSDMLINGYYRNARGAFYAADSGLSIARQQLEKQILTYVPPTYSANPIAAGSDATVCNTVLNMYSSPTSLNVGQGGNSWAESFVIPNTACCGIPCAQPMFYLASSYPTVNGYTYIYNYNISATGMAQGSEQTTVSETGSVILAVSGQQASSTINFAIFGGWVEPVPFLLRGTGPWHDDRPDVYERGLGVYDGRRLHLY